MRGTGRWAYGRTVKVGAATAAVSLLTLALSAPGGAAPAADAPTVPFGNGTGSAIALVYKVNPIFGNLSFGITAGESVAGHQNTGATAQSQSLDLGVIGVTLAAAGCKGADPTLAAENQPQAVIVRSDDPGAANGKTATEGGVISQSARATAAPYAQADTEIAGVGEQSGLFISGGKATATSGIVKPGVRTATAVTDIGKVNLLGGLLTLNGLHWEATQETGAKTTSFGSFSLGSINLAGNIIPLPSNALDQVNTLKGVLNSLGLTITLPQARVEQGVGFVDPLKIGVIPAVARDNLISQVLGALQPVRESLTKAIADLSCDGSTNVLGNNGSTIVTVLDLALGAVSGAGSLTFELGGVQATTAAISGFEFGAPPAIGGDTGGTDGSSVNLSDVGTDSGASLPNLGTDQGTGSTPPQLGTTGGSPSTPTKPIAKVNGSRGGVLAAVAGAGLLLLLITAEADRRKMRRAQREIMEV
jgi:hypothetical protein